MKFVASLAVALVVGVVAAQAHGPTRQKLIENVEIDKPVDKVWAIIKDFDGFSKWHPAAASSKATKGNEVGSVRTIVLKAPGDPEIVEGLLSYDDAGHSYHYEIQKVDVKVLPINNYTSWLKVEDNGHGGSTAEWKGAFYRGDQRNDPPPELNDGAAVAAVKGAYRAGLDNLKKIAETP